MDDLLISALEYKFAGDGATGEFSGYASVFNVQDGHGDMILPGAFAASLAERKAQNRMLPMHLMHGVFGGDGVPVGVWKRVEEDSKGLAVDGKISGMNTDAGRLLYERVKDGALPGLSIGYRIKSGGSTLGKAAGEPKRTIRQVHLQEISLVDDPSNAMSRVNEVKARARGQADPKVVAAIASAILEFRRADGADDEGPLIAPLLDAHEALTGQREPAATKSVPSTIREFETAIREMLQCSNSTAREIAAHGFKTATAPRDEAVEQASITAALSGLDLAGFSLAKL